MKIAVIGGTGLIGSQVVKILNASGHEAVAHAPSTGVDLLSGQGLPGALKGAGVVVNLTNTPPSDSTTVTRATAMACAVRRSASPARPFTVSMVSSASGCRKSRNATSSAMSAVP